MEQSRVSERARSSSPTSQFLFFPFLALSSNTRIPREIFSPSAPPSHIVSFLYSERMELEVLYTFGTLERKTGGTWRNTMLTAVPFQI